MDYGNRQRNTPLFLLISLALHALLFLIGPRLTAGLIPGFKPGEQGGVTYITLVDVMVPEQPRASVVEAARRPQATPEPRPLPEPAPEPEEASTPEPEPEPPAPEPVEPQVVQPVARVEAMPVAERPQEPQPQAVQPSAADSPRPVEAPERTVELSTPEPVEPEQIQVAVTPEPLPVLTSESGRDAAPTTAPPERVEEASSASRATDADPGEPARAEITSQPEASPQPESGGTGASEDVPSALPDAETGPEPVLPPTGISMVREFGSNEFPKDAVDLLNGTETVEIVVLVSPEGQAVDTQLITSSGISYLDEYALNLAGANRGPAIRYMAYDEEYEIRVFVTFESFLDAQGGRRSTISYRFGDRVTIPSAL